MDPILTRRGQTRERLRQSAMAKPTLAEVRSLAAEIRAGQPDIGNKKLAAEIKLAQPQWKLGNKELRNALRPPHQKEKQPKAGAAEPGVGEGASGKKRAVPAASAAAAPAKKKRKQAQAIGASTEKEGALGSLPGSFPYEIDAADHAETPLVAYEDVAPVLRGLAKHLSKQPADLRIWDPFYCTGAAAKRLASVGFPSVHHRCEDFHAIVAAGGDALPEHDVLVTNPPYSAEHLQKLFEHCAGSGKAWALLLPWFVVRKSWFRAYAAGSEEDRVAFLCPEKRYFFQPPKAMVEEGRDRVTAPFDTFWYLHMGSPAAQRETLAGWRVEREHRRLSAPYCASQCIPQHHNSFPR
jgi:hypothetical protein